MFDAVEGLVAEHADLEGRLAAPETHADQRLAKRLNQRYAELSAIVRTWREWQELGDDIGAARELASEDASFAEEAETLAERRAVVEEHLRHLLVPRDPNDAKDALLEVKSGEGGEESALFAGDLLRMYTRWAEHRGWSTEILDATESDLGGYKSVTVAVKAKGTPDPGETPYALLKFEGGVHRVQRVPITESQGRVHTSAAGVLVLPEAEQVDVTLDENDLRIDVFRSSGPGGQSVNTTDSAVRITHLPTGHRGQLPEREEPAPEQGVGDAHPAGPAARRRGGGGERRGQRRAQEPDPHRRPLRADPHVQLPREPHLRPPHRLQGLQPRHGARRRPRRGGRPARSTPTSPAGSRRSSSEPAAGRCGARPPTGSGRPASPRPSATPTSCWRTCSAPPWAGCRCSTRRDETQVEAYDALVARRAAREPLQHLLGTAAFRHVELEVGPGVFVPRPGDRAAGRLGDRGGRGRSRRPVVVDLCTGSGAIARAVADEVPHARVHAVELDEGAHAGRSATWPAPASTSARATWPPPSTSWPATVDVVVCNPPYIPLDAWESVAPEARDHDPHLALFSGDDGLVAMRVLERRAALLLQARGSGRRRARRRPGRLGARRSSAPPVAGPRSATTPIWPVVRGTSRPDWHDDPCEHALRGPARLPGAGPRGGHRGREPRRTTRRAGGAAHRHRLRPGRGRLRPGRRTSPAQGQGPRPGDAAAGAGQRGHHAGRARGRDPRLRPRAGRALLARPAHPRLHPADLAAVGPRRHPGHGRGADARPRAGPGDPRAHRPAGRQLGQHHRPPAGRRRRRRRGDARRRRRR